MSNLHYNFSEDDYLEYISYFGEDVFHASVNLQIACHGAAKASGWHNNLKTGLPFTEEETNSKFAERIALAHSELSEALEGHRKNLMDDKLPHRKMAEVELADCIIRIFDLAGAMGYDLGGAIAEKLIYNRERADHKIENRKKEGGKAY